MTRKLTQTCFVYVYFLLYSFGVSKGSNLTLNSSSVNSLQCQELVKHTIIHGEHLRDYFLYIPNSVCSTYVAVPIVVALHCFGCPPDFFRTLTPFADEFGFALILPVGLHRSWNAQHCCGEALRLGLDDVGFIQEVLREVRDTLGPLRSSNAINVMGWSNGGFMTTLLATSPRTSQQLTAVAPMAGYIYQGLNFITRPVPIFLHHARDDQAVRFDGCCTHTKGPPCCCGISQMGGRMCVSADRTFEIWASRINRCKGGRNYTTTFQDNHDQLSPSPGSLIHRSVHRTRFVQPSIECFAAQECQAASIMCTYDGGYGHQLSIEGRHSPPSMLREIITFFMRESCKLHGVLLDDNTCKCSRGYSGTYCLSKDSSF